VYVLLIVDFLSFFIWPLRCLFFFDIRILIAPLVSSNSSYVWDKELEIVKYILYLGIKLSKSGSFSNAKNELVNRGTKAMYEVLKSGRLHNLSV
jgi:hypothetical protein